MKINLNERIESIPTARGAEIIRAAYPFIKVAGGPFSCQLWELIMLFGPHISFGGDPLIEGASIDFVNIPCGTSRREQDPDGQIAKLKAEVAELSAWKAKSLGVLEDAGRTIGGIRSLIAPGAAELNKLRGYYNAIVKEIGHDGAIGELRHAKLRIEQVRRAVDPGVESILK